MPIGKPRKIKSPEQMLELWKEYKESCDNHTVKLTEFSAKAGDFITKEVNKPITATIEGFCVFIDLARSKFYQTYCSDEDYGDTIARMKFESEQDVRQKFESGALPSQLHGMWMSRYENYNNKQQIDVNATVTEADRSLLDKVSKRLEKKKVD